MPDNNGGRGLDLLTKQLMTLREKSVRWTRTTHCGLGESKELHALTELSKSTKAERNKFIYAKMDALAKEVGALKPRMPTERTS
jgi:hypothetical protein